MTSRRKFQKFFHCGRDKGHSAGIITVKYLTIFWRDLDGDEK
jgi:hypothetical protein